MKTRASIVEDVLIVNSNTDLVHSPDDNGWYFHDYKQDRTSIIYPTFDDAEHAWDSGKVKWDE